MIRACLLLVLARTLGAEEVTKGSWDVLQTLAPETRVEFVKWKQSPKRGRLVSVTADGISVRVRNGVVDVPRAEINRFAVRKARARIPTAIAAAALGLGVGLGLGGFLALNVVELGAEGVWGLGLFGAGIGFGTGIAVPGYETIYRVKRK